MGTDVSGNLLSPSCDVFHVIENNSDSLHIYKTPDKRYRSHWIARSRDTVNAINASHSSPIWSAVSNSVISAAGDIPLFQEAVLRRGDWIPWSSQGLSPPTPPFHYCMSEMLLY